MERTIDQAVEETANFLWACAGQVKVHVVMARCEKDRTLGGDPSFDEYCSVQYHKEIARAANKTTRKCLRTNHKNLQMEVSIWTGRDVEMFINQQIMRQNGQNPIWPTYVAEPQHL